MPSETTHHNGKDHCTAVRLQLTRWDLLHSNNNIYSGLVKSNLVKLETAIQ